MQRDTDRLKRTRGQPVAPVAARLKKSTRARTAVAVEAPAAGSEAPVRTPERTCVGCRQHDARSTLVRIVANEDGSLALDPKVRAGGRGAWVHAARKCVEQAVQRHAAERTLKVPVQKSLDAATLLAELREGMVRRVTSLLVVAARTRTLSIGTDAVEESLGRKGPAASAVLVATDAGETAQRLAAWAAEPKEGSGGRVVKVVSYSTKSELGRVFGRTEIALLALTDGRIATELAATIERLSGLEDRV